VALVGARGGRGSGSGIGSSLLRLREAWCRQWCPASCPGGAALVRPRWLEEDDTMELGMEERRRTHRQWLRRDGDARPTVAERRLDEVVAAWRSGRRVRLVASSRSGEWGPDSACGRGRRGSGSRRAPGGPDGKNRGGGEAADRWGPVTVLVV
jgi:hypothetical protein